MSIHEFDLEIAGRTARIIRKFPVNFGFIDYRHIITISVIDGPEDGPIAEVKLVPQWLWPVTPFRAAILFYSDKFEPLAKHVQDMVIVHELEHLVPHPKIEGAYQAKKHEVNDWQQMVLTLGPNWVAELTERPEYSIMLTDEADWTKALKKMSVVDSLQGGKKKGKKHVKRQKRRIRLHSSKNDNSGE